MVRYRGQPYEGSEDQADDIIAAQRRKIEAVKQLPDGPAREAALKIIDILEPFSPYRRRKLISDALAQIEREK
jgi:hypothetical protein